MIKIDINKLQIGIPTSELSNGNETTNREVVSLPKLNQKQL